MGWPRNVWRLFSGELCLCLSLRLRFPVGSISTQLIFAGSAVLGPRSVPFRLLQTPLAFSVIYMAAVKYGAIFFSPLYKLHFDFWPGWLRDSFILETQNFWQTFHIVFFAILCCGGVSFTWNNFLLLDLWIRLYVFCFFLLEPSIILIMDSFPFR